MEGRYISTILLHAVGDTIGFKNGDWEFFTATANYNDTLEKLYEFINLGGINGINLDGWMISDDTILHMAIAKSLLSTYKSLDELKKNTVSEIVKACDDMDANIKKKNRYVGVATHKHYLMLKKGDNWKKFNFDSNGGGNGASMRSHCIGLAFFGEDNRNKLIEYAIDSSRMTHVNPTGWMGGLTTALMTAYAIEGIHIYKWIPMVLKILESDKIRKMIDMDSMQELRAYEFFVQGWKTYYELRFKDGKPTKSKAHNDLKQRQIFYNGMFDNNPPAKNGYSGYSSIIVAYDCLIDAEDNWEKLVIYSMINSFDTDTIGAISGGLYGAMYGASKVPKNNTDHIEEINDIINTGRLLYKKYYSHEKI